MHPILFRWGSAVLQTYSVMLSLAFFTGLGVWIFEGRAKGLVAEVQVNLALVGFTLGLLGARLLFILTEWRHFASGQFGIFNIWEGGVVFLGGFLFAAPVVLWLMKRWGMPLRAGLDTAAPALCFAHAVGRLGCFLNGCCYGHSCHLPWAVTYQNPLAPAPTGIPLHPSQLYEMLGLIVLGTFLMFYNRRARPKISGFRIYLLGYAVLRFFVEFTRGDTLRGEWAGLSTSQWLSLGLIFGALLLDFKDGPYHNSPNESRNRKSRGPQQKTHH